MAQILVIDKEPRIREALTVFEPLGHEVSTLSAPEAAFSQLRKSQPEIVFAEAENSGLELMRHVLGEHPSVAFILTSSLARKETAVQALRGGASDFLVKPFTAREATDAVKRALALREGLVAEAIAVQTTQDPALFLAREGTSRNAGRIRAQIEALLSGGGSHRVLITGPKGTGKYELASLLHQERAGGEGRFVTVDVGKLRAEALRTQLAFHDGSPGRAFAEAAGGTVVIESAELLPDSLQSELLESAGDEGDGTLVVFTSNADVPALARKGEFNADLFVVLSSAHLELEPLDKRTEDIPAMVGAILRFSAGLDDAARGKRLTDNALKALTKRKYPANMVELERVVVASVLAAGGETVDAIV